MRTCPTCTRDYDDSIRFCPHDATSLESVGASDPLIGQVLSGRYRVLRQLGRGGMGVVYLAEHIQLARQVALKVISGSLLGDHDIIMRFRREAMNAARIAHPNIAALYDAGETESGVLFIVMEYVEGSSLRDILDEEGSLPLNRALPLVCQVASGLAVAHRLGIIHRDLKPENVLIGRDDGGGEIAKVVDFGIARAMHDDSQKLTRTGLTIGSPSFMSPEQVTAGELDGRSDQYSLAIVAFALVTGTLPFEGQNTSEILVARLTQRPRRLDDARPDIAWPAMLQSALDRALSLRPDHRYPGIADFERDLAAVLDATRNAATGTPEPGSYAVVLTPPATDTASATDPRIVAPADGETGRPVAAPSSEAAVPAARVPETDVSSDARDRPATRTLVRRAQRLASARIAGIAAAIVTLVTGGWAVAQMMGPRTPDEQGVEESDGGRVASSDPSLRESPAGGSDDDAATTDAERSSIPGDSASASGQSDTDTGITGARPDSGSSSGRSANPPVPGRPRTTDAGSQSGAAVSPPNESQRQANADPPASVGRVVVEPATIQLTEGTSQSLSARVEDGQGGRMPSVPVAWSSSAPGVVSVDAAGRITALRPGTALIAARAESVETRAAITVVAAPVAPDPQPPASGEPDAAALATRLQSVVGDFVAALNSQDVAAFQRLHLRETGADTRNADALLAILRRSEADVRSSELVSGDPDVEADAASVEFRLRMDYVTPFGRGSNRTVTFRAFLERDGNDWTVRGVRTIEGL